jgi:WD40 repeat protein
MIVTGHETRELAFLDDVTVTSLEKGHVLYRDVETARPARPTVPVDLTEQLYYATSIDGSRRAGRGSKDKLSILEGDTGMLLLRTRTIRDCMFALSGDGDYLVMSTEAGLIELLDATSGASIAEFRHPAVELDRTFALTPDGSRLISCDNAGTILVWDVRSALHGRIPPVKPLEPTKLREQWTALGSRKPCEKVPRRK